MIIALLNKSSRYASNSNLLVDIAAAITKQLIMEEQILLGLTVLAL